MAQSGPDRNNPEKRNIVDVRISKKSTVKMQNIANRREQKRVGTMNQTTHEPLMVTQEAVEAYERRTGFYGIGRSWLKTGTGTS